MNNNPLRNFENWFACAEREKDKEQKKSVYTHIVKPFALNIEFSSKSGLKKAYSRAK